MDIKNTREKSIGSELLERLYSLEVKNAAKTEELINEIRELKAYVREAVKK